MSEITVMVGSKIKEYRVSKKLSQEELAHMANMHPSHIGAIERGEKSSTIDSIHKIVNALDISFQELFDFESKPEIAEDIYSKKLYSYINTLTPKDQKGVYKAIKMLMKWKENE